MATLGFIGLGKMGGRVAKRLVDAGHTVTGYNRTKSKAQWLLDAGMQWGESPRKVAEKSDVIFSMVTNTAALHEILNGDDGILAALAPGKVYIDMSTISASASRDVAAQVEAREAHMLGAQHLTLFMVEFQPGGEGNIHDHPFEETYFFLSGEAEAILDGQTYHVKAGDYVWTSVGGTHGFFNKGTVPMRWIETQTPQPPNQQAFRFPADWAYLATKLDM